GVVNRHGAHTVVNLEGGQLSHSLRFMAKAWGWRSDFRVRTFLNRLKTSAQINAQTVAGQNVITICNYERYQNPEAARGSQTNAQISAQYTRNTRKEEERKKERIDHDASRQGDSRGSADRRGTQGKTLSSRPHNPGQPRNLRKAERRDHRPLAQAEKRSPRNPRGSRICRRKRRHGAGGVCHSMSSKGRKT